MGNAAKKNTGGVDSFNDKGGKHSPVVVEAVPNADGSVDVKVVVSGDDGATEDDKLHPMTSGHWITDIWIESDSGEVIFLIEALFWECKRIVPKIMRIFEPNEP